MLLSVENAATRLLGDCRTYFRTASAALLALALAACSGSSGDSAVAVQSGVQSAPATADASAEGGMPATPKSLSVQGPGLGNLTYTQNELFKPLAWIRRDDQGTPATYAGRKAFGLNAGIMHNGYFLTLFAPDSGLGPGGFLVYDVSNPRSMQLVKRIYEPEGRTSEFREAHSFGVSTIGGKQYVAIATTKGVEFWDFTDVQNAQQVKKLALPTVNAGDYTNVSWQLWWQAPYLYVASSNDGVYIIDASDPANAVIANRGAGKPNPVPTGELGGFRVGPIFSMGNQLVLTSMDNTSGFASLDISDPLNPKVLDSVASHTFYYATCYDGERLFTSVRGAGAKMTAFNLSNRSRFVAEDNRLVMNEQLYCATQDHYVFQGAQYRIHKVDVGNPQQHVEVGRGGMFPAGSSEESHSDHGQVAPFGNLIFVGNDHGSGSAFMVHDTAPDTTPPAVRQVSPANAAQQQVLTSRIGVALSDSILPESVNASTFIVRPQGGAALAGFYSVQLGIVNFSPAQPLQPNTTYEVVLPAGGIKDYARNGIAAEWKSSFTTGNAVNMDLAHHWSLARTLADPVGMSDGSSSASDAFASIGIDLSQRSAGIELADDSVASVLAGTSTLSFYMKTTQVGTASPWTAPGIFGRDQASGSNDVFWGWLDNTGRINLSVGDVSASNPVTKSAQPVNDGQWRHVVMTRDAASGVQSLHVDGVKVTTTGRTGALGLNNRFRTLGQIQGNPVHFKGSLAEVRVYRRVLSDSDIAQLAAVPVVGDPGIGQGAHTVGGTLAFNSPVLGGSAQYSWNFGDGNRSAFSSQPQANHSYATPGHYTVTLTVRTADGLETYYTYPVTVTHPATALAPTHTTNITGDASQVYSVNPDSGTVTAMDAQSLAKIWEVNVGREPKTLAVGPDGRIWVTVQADDRLVALNAANGSVSASLPLAYGSGPYGVVFTPDRTTGVLTLESKSMLVSFDPTSGAITGSTALTGDVRGVAVSADSKSAYVTRFRSAMNGGQVHKVQLAGMTLQKTLPLRVDTTTVDDESRSRGVPNYLSQIVISPDGLRASLPSKKDNIVRGRARDGNDLLHDRTVRSILTQLDMQGDAEVFGEQLDFDDRAPARAAVYAPRGDFIFVAQMEGNNVAIVDAYSRALRGEIMVEGMSAPHGLHIDATRQRLFVNNFLSRSVSVLDVANVLSGRSGAAALVQTVQTVGTEPFGAAVLRGKKLFYKASDRRMSRDNYMSCASCHADGADDGMVWDFTQRGEGLRRTISLQGRQGAAHGRFHWTANFDEIQDFENDIRNEFGGTGFLSNADFQATSAPLGTPKAGRSSDLDDLAAYVTSLARLPRSPVRNADGSLSASALAGKQVFATAQCASCHSGATMRDGLRHDVGTIRATSGSGSGQPLAGVGFDTPTLLGVWSNPVFLHDGQADSVLALLGAGHGNAGNLAQGDRVALADYVRSLDTVAPRVRIRSAHSNLCVNIEGKQTASGAAAIQYGCGMDANELFDVNTVDDHVQFEARHSRLCLAETLDPASGKSRVVQLACTAGGATQWKSVGATLVNRSSGRCLDVPDLSLVQVPLITYACNGGNNQNWGITQP